MDSMEVLDQNLTILRDFKTLSADRMQIFRDHGKQFDDGRYELYKAQSSTTGILAAASTVIPHLLNFPFECMRIVR